MICHYRTYPDSDDWTDEAIGYSAGGYELQAVPSAPRERPSQPFAGKHVALLRALAAEGQPFTVRQYGERFGVPYHGAQLYDTLALLVKVGELTRTECKHVGVYQGVRQ